MKLRVLDCNGGPVASCKIDVLRYLPTWKATTDEQGHWRMEEHIPPGDYVICAAQANASNNPFDALLQMKNSELPLSIRAEHTTVEKAPKPRST